MDDRVQLVDTDATLTKESEDFLSETIISYIGLRNLADPYYYFTTFTDRWNEYDRCYEVRAKNNRGEHEYQGFSNIVLPDFHDKIETLRVREMNTFFSGADLFETSALKYSNEEDAHLAQVLVKYNFKIVDMRTETSNILLDKYKYGTWIAYTPYTVEDVATKDIIDYIVDEATGQPLEINGVIQKTAPYEAEIIREKKFTDLQYINLKKVYIHPRIKGIEDQPAIFLLAEKTWQDLLDMEEDGIIGQGMADWIREHGGDDNLDNDVEESEDEKSNDEELDDEVKVYNVYYAYYKFGEEDDRKTYEAVMSGQDKILGLQELPGGYPFICGQHIAADGFYGIGAGDEMYPVYIAKCARYNQVFDLSTYEILGGGFKDATTLPEFNNIIPGEYKAVTGLSAMLAGKGKPILSWRELQGSAPSSIGLDILPELDRAMQSGTGAVSLLAGMPTDSQIDKTAAGVKATIGESNARVNAYIEDFENQCFKKYAEKCYDNYTDYLDPAIDIPNLLDVEDYTYFDNETGEQKMVNFPKVLRDVDITFSAVKKVLEAEKEIGKIQRFMQILQGIMMTSPEFGQEILRRVDLKYLVTEIAKSLDIADLDKLFPQMNLAQELMDMSKELQMVDMENETLKTGINMATQKLEQLGDKTALNVIEETMQELGGANEQGMGASQQSQPTAV